MITVSDAAAAQILDVLNRDGWPAGSGLRLGLKDGGCSGFFYQIAFERAPEEDDMVHEEKGVRVFVHPLHLPFLAGSNLVWKEALVETGFSVENPNVRRACGCGESVEF